jgi:hypothetical protein
MDEECTLKMLNLATHLPAHRAAHGADTAYAGNGTPLRLAAKPSRCAWAIDAPVEDADRRGPATMFADMVRRSSSG